MNEATPSSAIDGKWKALLGFSFLAALLVFLAGFYYFPLGNDGGWYSFPAAAMSQGASPAQNLESIEALETQGGLKAKFPFKTYPSVRVPYTALWLKLMPRNIVFLKLLSLLEFIALAVAAYFLFSRFLGSKLFALALVAVLLNDKQIVMGAAWDYRPDDIMAALACCAFVLLLRKDKVSHYVAALLAIGLMPLIHVTAPVPLAFMLSFFVFKELFSGKIRPRYHYKYVLAGAVALVVLFNYNAILDTLMFVERPPVENVMHTGTRVVAGWTKGVDQLLSKEATRLRGYFPSSNLTQLVVLIAGFAFLIRQLFRSSFRDPVALALLSSTSVVFLFMAAFDPHPAPKHLVLLAPMFLLFLGYGLQREPNKKGAELVLAMIVGLVSLSSVAVAAKYTVVGERSNYNIASVGTLMSEIMDSDREYVVVGPTELWPFFDSETDVLILDHARPRGISELLGPLVGRIDYVIMNVGYTSWNWEKRFLESFPDLQLTRIRHMGSAKLFVTVYEIEERAGREEEAGGAGEGGEWAQRW